MFLTVLLQVIGRYILFNPFIWTEELSRYFYVWMVFCGIGVVIKNNENIMVDVIFNLLPQKWQKAIALVSNILILIFSIIMFISGIKMMYSSGIIRCTTMLFLTYNWVYLAIVVGAILIIIFTIQNFFKGDDAKWK